MLLDAYWLQHWELRLPPFKSELLKCKALNMTNCGSPPVQDFAVPWYVCSSFNADLNTAVFSFVSSGSLWLFLPSWFGSFKVLICIKDLTLMNFENNSLHQWFAENESQADLASKTIKRRSHFQSTCDSAIYFSLILCLAFVSDKTC